MRKTLSFEERVRLFEDDEWTCQACGMEGDTDDLEVDHAVPLSRGGSNERENLQTLCIECNRMKGSLTMDEFLEEMDEDSQEDEAALVGGASGALVGLTIGGPIGGLLGGLIGLILGGSVEE